MELRKTAEQLFRRGAMWAYTLNQSPAKVVMDPVYVAVAKRLLADAGPLPEKLRNQTFAPNLFLPYRTQSRKLTYFIEDWDWDSARPELLTPRQRQMMHTVALGETSGAAVGDGFLRVFRTEPELAAFFGLWHSEELNHFMGYHLYLKKMNEAWPAERGLEVAEVEWTPYSEDPMELAACNMYQELIGFLIYRSFSRQVKDPFLSKMLAQFAKDECRHFRFYEDVVMRHLQRHPEFRVTVLKTFLKATAPYNQVSGKPANVLDHLAMGAFYFRKAEFDYFVERVEALTGGKLRAFWEWYFQGVVEPCTVCARSTVHCDCAQYESDEKPALRNPRWWTQVSRKVAPRPELSLDAWAQQVFSSPASAVTSRGTSSRSH
jgi:rubrerythrin